MRYVKKEIKYGRAGQATHDNVAHAQGTLGNCGHRHVLRIRNTYCSSTATMVARMRLDVTFYVHCLSCLIWIELSL